VIHSLSVVVVSGQMLVLHNILSVSAPDLFGVLDESIFVVFSSVLRIRCILIRIRIRFVETRILFRIRPKIEKKMKKNRKMYLWGKNNQIFVICYFPWLGWSLWGRIRKSKMKLIRIRNTDFHITKALLCE